MSGYELKELRRVFWQQAACAALTGIHGDGDFVSEADATIAGRAADLMLVEWDKRFSESGKEP